MLFFLLSYFLSFFLPSDGLAQRCVNLSRRFTHEIAAFYTEQCTSPSLFHNFGVSQGARSHSLKNQEVGHGTLKNREVGHATRHEVIIDFVM